MSDALPPAHRFVGFHDPTSGAPQVIDEDLQLFPVPDLPGMSMGLIYTQTGLPHDPHKAQEGATKQPEGRIIDGAVLAVLELAPGTSVPLHYTNSLDFITLTHGQLECQDHENKTRTIKAGTVIVQCSFAHGFTNSGPGTARMVCTVLPSKTFKIDGKSLQEAKGIFCMA